MKTEVLNVTGMTCGGCVANVKKALSALPGVASVAVSLPNNQAEVQFDDSKLGVDQMRGALKSAGYGVGATPEKSVQRGGCCGS